MTQKMQDNSKPRYACPRCAAKLKTDFGRCPKCGFIGAMHHEDIHLSANTAAGKSIIADPPTRQQDTEKKKPPKPSSTTTQYKCPHCDTKVSKAYGHCPNRSCGYAGPMKTRGHH